MCTRNVFTASSTFLFQAGAGILADTRSITQYPRLQRSLKVQESKLLLPLPPKGTGGIFVFQQFCISVSMGQTAQKGKYLLIGKVSREPDSPAPSEVSGEALKGSFAGSVAVMNSRYACNLPCDNMIGYSKQRCSRDCLSIR